MGKTRQFGFTVNVTLPPDVEEIIQEQRDKWDKREGHKPPRGTIIAEAVRGFFQPKARRNQIKKRSAA